MFSQTICHFYIQQIKSALCLNNSNLNSCSRAANLNAAILELLTSSIAGCKGNDSLPGDIGGDIDGERFDLVAAWNESLGRIFSGDDRECSAESLLSSERRRESWAVRFTNKEWKCACDVGYKGAPNSGRESGGKYCVPNSWELAYLLKNKKIYWH